MNPQFASAGNAPETKSGQQNPEGLYYRKRPEDGADLYVGALEMAAADAVVQQGFVLRAAGLEAAKMSEADIEAKWSTKDIKASTPAGGKDVK